MRNICTMEGCPEDVVGRGLCRKHYMRWKRWGNPEEPDHRSMRTRARCLVRECENQVHGQGLCVTHYRQRERDNDPAVGPHQHQCIECGRPFLSRYKERTRFCSKRCGNRHRNRTPEYQRKRKEAYYQKRYGLSFEQVEQMRGEGCAICGRFAVDGRWEGNLHIDHDHETGEVRGVLCHGCNVSLGHLSTRELLEAAIGYLD